MKRVNIPEPHKLELVEVPDPAPGTGEVLLAIKAIGICGSDLHTYEGQHPFVSYPVLPGHEVSGEVIAVGAGVDAALIGKKAVIEPSIAEGTRPKFEPGRYNIASGLRVMGFQTPGAMAERFAVPLDRIHLIPEEFTHEQGAYVEPLAVAVHGVRLAGNIAGLDVAVIGAGTIGLLVAQVARAYGAASVVIADLSVERRAIAETLGLRAVEKLPEQAFDVVAECVGVQATLQSAIYASRKGATVLVLGVFGADVAIPAGLIQDWELRVLGSLMYVGDDYREAIRLMDAGLVEVSPLTTHRFSLADVQTAFDSALQRGATLKVMLTND
ncbi:MAG: alcohol dehydrogenase catalytic domain-containing protein [Chloroflexota bacterium]